MNYSHVGEDADSVEFSREPDFNDQGDAETRRPVKQLMGALLIDIEFITAAQCAKIIYVGTAPKYMKYLTGLFPRVKFHVYDDCSGPVVAYGRPFDTQDAHEWGSRLNESDTYLNESTTQLNIDHFAVSFYHSKSPECYDWWVMMKPAAALFAYGPDVPSGGVVRVPYGDVKYGNGLAVFVLEPTRSRIKYRAYIPPAQTCTIDDVDVYASSDVDRVGADNCYECYAARDIISMYLVEAAQTPDTAAARYAMLADIAAVTR